MNSVSDVVLKIKSYLLNKISYLLNKISYLLWNDFVEFNCREPSERTTRINI